MDSVWQQVKENKKYPTLEGEVKTQVLVIGGGMAGILCARALQEAGKEVIVCEAGRIGGGITGKTTAVLTAQHDFLYSDMIKRFDEVTAKAYLHGNLNAVKTFRKLSETIDCDFEDMPSIQYSREEGETLRKELEAVRKLGFSAELTDKPWFLDNVTAVEYPGMAQFHPLKFLYGAAKDLTIYENSPARKL